MSQADSLIYELSGASQTVTEPFVKKEVLYVLDQNGGSSYNGQVLIETSPIANSGKWADYQASYLTVPYVIALQSTFDLESADEGNPFLMGMKSGGWNIFDSWSVELNGTQIIQITPYSNIYCTYRALTSWSQDDLVKYGALTYFYPDSAHTHFYNAQPSSYGLGLSNNVITLPALQSYALNSSNAPIVNEGFYNRLVWNSNNPGVTTSDNGVAGFLSQASANRVGLNSVQTTGSGVSRIYYWSYLLIVRLKDLADYFNKVPLLKGSFYKLILNTNGSTNSIRTGMTGASGVTGMGWTSASAIQVQGRTNPVLIPAAVINNPWQQLAPQSGTITIAAGIKSATIGGVTVSNSQMTSCRWYVPTYTMNPTYESQYISLHPTKSIVYEDIYNYVIQGVPAGSSFNQLITNGITDIQTVWVLPFLSASANSSTAGVSPIQSPFTTEPSTTSPLLAITSFQIQIAGLNLFQQDYTYDFQQFADETASMYAVNGGVTTGLTSGLIGFDAFQQGYRVYCANASRRLPLDNSVPKSVQILGTNASSVAVDYYCFVTFSRKITVDVRTGAIV